MFNSQEHLYCNHVSCCRRFRSEIALDKHCMLFHGRPTCDVCGMKLKKASKHRCPALDCYLPINDYPALDIVPDMNYDNEIQFLEKNLDLVMDLSPFESTGSEQEAQDDQRYYGCNYYGNDFYYDNNEPYCPGHEYDGSYHHELLNDFYDRDPVEIYDAGDYGDHSDGYDPADHSFEEDETKLASPIPLPVHLSQALTRLIEKYGNEMSCDYYDSDEEECGDSSGSEWTLHEDSSDPENHDPVVMRSAVWTPNMFKQIW